jgi:glucose/arabinose dehydrogenase
MSRSLSAALSVITLLAAVASSTARADELIPVGAEWRYLKGEDAPPAAWNTGGFDDDGWASGEAGIGYGDGDDATVLDDMEGNYLTVYARREFQASPASIESLVLRIRYDDGFVAYLNGVEVARRGLGAEGDPVAFDTPAGDHEATGFESIDISSKIPFLAGGTNVLAIEVHNRDLGSSDLSLHPNLQANVPIPTGPWPPGFDLVTVQGGFQTPVAVAFAGDGRMFVGEKRGLVWVVKDGATLATPFIDLQDEVGNASDRGLLGIELDPDFATNGFVYFLYVVDPTAGAPDESGQTITFGRLTRYRASGDAAVPGSRRILLGSSEEDGFIHCHSSHAIGSVKFAADGSLFVGSGDGAHFDFTDGGQDVTSFDPLCDDVFGDPSDIGALRSQDLDSLAGKILRIDPETGLGLPDNPFFDGDAASARSRTWVLGLRNPFRFTVRPDSGLPGALYIGDVGWNVYEELNAAVGGENFGWPCYEGFDPQGSYQSNVNTSSYCQSVSAGAVTDPLIAWHHSDAGTLGFAGNCASGAAFYTGTAYPRKYQGACFFADYGQNWIRVAFVDENESLTGIEDFATDMRRPVDLETHPQTGDLHVVSIETGEVRRFVYTVGNRAPSVSMSAAPTAGPAPLQVVFSSTGTFDADNDPLSFEWDFGDGSPLDTTPSPTHIYAASGTFTATLTVRDDRDGSSSDSVTIETSNLPPAVVIDSPAAGTTFFGGEQFTLRATASDPEDDSLDLEVSWRVDLHHEDHVHPEWFVSDEREPVFEAASHGSSEESFWYEVKVTARDTGGLEATATVDLVPGEVLRGDGNADGEINISDPIAALLYMFSGAEAACALAMDIDANGEVNVTDAVRLLNHLFVEGPGPEAPYPDCGVAANREALPCGEGCGGA